MGRLIQGTSPQVEKHQGDPVPFRERSDSLIEQLPKQTSLRFRLVPDRPIRHGLILPGPPPAPGITDVLGQPPGEGVQPPAERRIRAQRGGLARQRQEDRLRDILCLMVIVQHAQADLEHHRLVTPYQFAKGRLIALVGKRPQQLAIRSFLETCHRITPTFPSISGIRERPFLKILPIFPSHRGRSYITQLILTRCWAGSFRKIGSGVKLFFTLIRLKLFFWIRRRPV
jgi:hypothetical protein